MGKLVRNCIRRSPASRRLKSMSSSSFSSSMHSASTYASRAPLSLRLGISDRHKGHTWLVSHQREWHSSQNACAHSVTTCTEEIASHHRFGIPSCHLSRFKVQGWVRLAVRKRSPRRGLMESDRAALTRPGIGWGAFAFVCFISTLLRKHWAPSAINRSPNEGEPMCTKKDCLFTK